MSETEKKTKAPAKPRKAPAKKAAKNVETMPSQEQRAVSQDRAGSRQGTVSHDEVAQLAHRYWNERGRKHGHHEEDWYRAEQELRGKAS